MTIFQLHVVLFGCSVNNRKGAAFDRSILHIMQYTMYLQ